MKHLQIVLLRCESIFGILNGNKNIGNRLPIEVHFYDPRHTRLPVIGSIRHDAESMINTAVHTKAALQEAHTVKEWTDDESYRGY